MRIGLIGGTGLYSLPKAEPVDLELGDERVTLWRTTLGGRETFFLPRHGPSHEHVPLRIPHVAHIRALRAAKCDFVLGVNSVGSLRRELRPATWAIPRDFLDFHHANRPTLHPAEPVHTDFTDAYCPTIRLALRAASQAPEVTYVGVDGPRFETAAEVAWFAAAGGDVVGMTGVPEAVLAREAGLCYGSLCYVANHATGLGARPDPKRIQADLSKRRRQLVGLLEQAIRRLPRAKTCDCQRVPASLRAVRRGR